jgi:SAM-dependent methyltransferase
MLPEYQTFVDKLRTRLADASNETEVRDRFCAEVYSQYNITFKMERGRSDAELNQVVLEFKDKGLFSGKSDSAKFQEAYAQLTQKYLPTRSKKDNLPQHHYIGVAIDGTHYAFVFYEENGKHRHTELLPIDTNSIYPLLVTLTTDKRRAFNLENLISDFGAESQRARALISQLWKHLASCLDVQHGSGKVQMLFQEWAKLFAQATNLGRVGKSKIDSYLLSVGIERPIDYTKALFVLHTYNALLLQLIAGELVTSLRYTKHSGFASYAAGMPLPKLRDLLDSKIEHAEVFVNSGVTNFIESDFFGWYLEETPPLLLSAVKEVLACLGLYSFPTVQSTHITDVIKAFYQNVVPEVLRRNIGEFYTPEWLVQFVLDETGYSGPDILNKRLLDPCCGSGNFLIHSIARLKEVARGAGLNPKEILELIQKNIIGIDLNPLAVLSARLNYLLAVADILPQYGTLEIPVYMADAIYAPTPVKGDLDVVRSYEIGTMKGAISINMPELLVQDREMFGEILNVMARNIEVESPADAFINEIKVIESTREVMFLHPQWIVPLSNMYDQLLEMERQKWDRIWTRIIKNHFASIAIGQFDYIVSNPPWVRWSELPEDYRERIKPTCLQYAIFSNTPFFGGNELDISGMIAYTVTDKWLKSGGVLSFVITQIHFQAPSSEGFRAFQLPDGSGLEVLQVHDFTDVRPFPALANKPAIFTWKKGQKTIYPVPYYKWSRKDALPLSEHSALEAIKGRITSVKLEASPIPPDNRWSIISAPHKQLLGKLQGGSSYWTGRKGITTDLNGVYFVELLGNGVNSNTVKVRTTPNSGRRQIPLIERDIEKDVLYPLLKSGEQIRRFSYTPSPLAAIVPNKTIKSSTTDVQQFMRGYPMAYRYFARLNQEKDAEGVALLESRSTWRTRMALLGLPFYAIYNVGAYTFAPYKVVWAEISGSLAAAVVSTQEMPLGIGTKPIIPDHKVYFVACSSAEEAHFLCALLNSEPVRTFVDSFTVKLQVGTIFRHLNAPVYNPAVPSHKKLADLSNVAHRTGVNSQIQKEIDDLMWELLDWSE